MNGPFDPTGSWPALVRLQQRMLEAHDQTELAFLAANETWHLVPYQQAVVFFRDALGRPSLQSISGLVSAQEATPYTLWLADVCRACFSKPEAANAQTLTAGDLPDALREGWAEWWPEHALCEPLVTPGGRHLGAVFYLRDEAWADHELALLEALHRHCAYCLNTFRRSRSSLAERWRGLRRKPAWLAVLIAALVAILALPVPLSVLAPAEIIALRAQAIAAPTEGVIKTFHARPNQPVKKGQPLFSLDDTTLRNRRDIAAQALAVARSDALTAGQKAFDNVQSKAELAALQGKVREKEAEVAYLDELLGRIEVVADSDGVFVAGDPNDWIGKPVVTGERIAQLAQPGDLGVMVWVPVGDAIALDVGAHIRVYLQVSPLDSLSGTLVETSYQASPSPENVASYRVRGKLDAGEAAHIGLRGVAKVYGGHTPLAYWVMRRPLGALRQWIGL